MLFPSVVQEIAYHVKRDNGKIITAQEGKFRAVSFVYAPLTLTVTFKHVADTSHRLHPQHICRPLPNKELGAVEVCHCFPTHV